MEFSAFDETTGEIVMAMEVPEVENALENLASGQLLIGGYYDGAVWYVGPEGDPILRPTIPAPVQEGQLLTWETPPPGLTALVYDLWTEPPHQLAETPLSAPDCGIFFVEAGAYRLDLTADFPWLPLSMEVSS